MGCAELITVGDESLTAEQWGSRVGISATAMRDRFARVARGKLSLVDAVRQGTERKQRHEPLSRVMLAAIDHLPLEDDEFTQEVLARHPHGLPLKYIAEILGVTVEGAEQAIKRALAAAAHKARGARSDVREALHEVDRLRSKPAFDQHCDYSTEARGPSASTRKRARKAERAALERQVNTPMCPHELGGEP